MAKIFVDCTYTFATRADRGIARVVRNIVSRAAGHPGVCCVVFARGAFRVMPEAELSIRCASPTPARRGAACLVRTCGGFLLMIAGVLPAAPGRRLLARTVYNRRLGWRARLALRSMGAAESRGAGRGPAVALDASPAPAAGDVLFLPDAGWNVDCDAHLSELCDKGVRIVLLCHDLLPLTHKHLCADPEDVFRGWLCRWLPRVDGVICNSESTRRQLLRFVKLVALPLRADCWIESCPLGGDLQVEANAEQIDLQNVPVAASEPYYLTVGAIEPRKNHALLLQALGLFWSAGGRARSVWVGRWTLDAQALRRQVRREAAYGKQLVALEGVADAALVGLYKQARAAIFPSLGEGFGLPLAEALFYGCPVVASDIPAHREVCGDRAIYFDPNDALSLADVLTRLERGELAPARVAPDETCTWQQSVARMFELIRHHCDDQTR